MGNSAASPSPHAHWRLARLEEGTPLASLSCRHGFRLWLEHSRLGQFCVLFFGCSVLCGLCFLIRAWCIQNAAPGPPGAARTAESTADGYIGYARFRSVD